MQRLHRRLLLAAVLLLGLAAHAARSATVPDDMSMGDPKAKVTVVEYASVACPICGRWYKEVWPAFKAKYVDTGKIHYVTREMLVGDDSEVSLAAAGFLLARCAGKDKYFTVTDAIYKSQPGVYDAPRETLLGIARSVGMDEARFNACISDKAALSALNNRVDSYVKKNHVNATPTFVINGKAMKAGYHSLAELDAAIDAAQNAKSTALKSSR